MKKIISICLAMIFASCLIFGCDNQSSQPKNYKEELELLKVNLQNLKNASKNAIDNIRNNGKGENQ